jgi:hypothetical protein
MVNRRIWPRSHSSTNLTTVRFFDLSIARSPRPLPRVVPPHVTRESARTFSCNTWRYRGVMCMRHILPQSDSSAVCAYYCRVAGLVRVEIGGSDNGQVAVLTVRFSHSWSHLCKGLAVRPRFQPTNMTTVRFAEWPGWPVPFGRRGESQNPDSNWCYYSCHRLN